MVLMNVCLVCLCLRVVEIESIPEENPEEPGDQEATAADAYVSEGKSHRSFTLTMFDPK